MRHSTVRCERCDRMWPGFSRSAVRRTAIQGSLALAAITALATLALAS